MLEYRNLGRSGLKVSRIALGCLSFGSPSWRPWVLDREGSRPIVRRALDLGINFFDTADYYSSGASEEVVGALVHELVDRQSIVIATKLFAPMHDGANGGGLSRKHVMEAVDASLRRLGTDYIDLYQVHRWDPDTPIEETLDALNDVVRAGKARYLGASSMAAWQFMKALGLQRASAWAPFVSMQSHYNLIYREEEREMVPLCLSEGIGIVPWSPLARGFLAGKRGAPGAPSIRSRTPDPFADRYGGRADEEVLDCLIALGARLGKEPAELAISWLASRNGVTAPIVGVTRPEQLEQAVAALSLVLDPVDVAALEAPYRPRAVIL